MSSYPPSRRPWAAHVDMYRKIPTDLLEGTQSGSIFSYLSFMLMLVLIVYETASFMFPSRIVTDLKLDRSDDPRIRLNFNITMMDLKCDWAVIDVVSALGTYQNVTAHITKWNLNAQGIRKGYQGRNRNQKDIDLFDTTVLETLEELHENGEDAIQMTPESLEHYKQEYEFVFVDFYASWCSHCRDLAPTWEALAEVMIDAGVEHQKLHGEDYSDKDYDEASKLTMPVVIGKIDCVQHQNLCNYKERIQAYPTLRLFVDGQPWKKGDYRGHRTILEMVEWLYYVEEQHNKMLEESGDEASEAKKLHLAHQGARGRLHPDDEDKEHRRWTDQTLSQKRALFHEWRDEEHPGCQLNGHLLLDRAPGNFHILARSSHHEIAPHMANVSHMVNTLSIGDPMAKIRIDRGEAYVPPEVQVKMAPMDGNVYVTTELHQSYHHYLKLVSTRVEGLRVGNRDLRVYQILPNSQLALYGQDKVPEAKFAYDLSPIAVTYRKDKVAWYEYCTSLMAIVGGVFTVVGMIESSIHAAARSRRRR